MIKSHEIKNVTDFNVADSVRRDIKVLMTKTRYTVILTIDIIHGTGLELITCVNITVCNLRLSLREVLLLCLHLDCSLVNHISC